MQNTNLVYFEDSQKLVLVFNGVAGLDMIYYVKHCCSGQYRGKETDEPQVCNHHTNVIILMMRDQKIFFLYRVVVIEKISFMRECKRHNGELTGDDGEEQALALA